ncbi:carnitine O-acetyltransferase [Saccharomycopsis crataegensis]|uniref:Carnitine O-acetyltransferase n=1 Tax=Saccharomycopsis crataegensis TaxID=43959 RepID=A0AAV5QHG4_9ASCO|nr:carnitine O-acetyltransferase [Saccharomycopsis crataegensis]
MVKDKFSDNEQPTLQKLPLPSIGQSIEGITRAIQPLVTQNQFKETISKLESLKSNKLVQILQAHLEDFNSTHVCYLDLFSNVRDHNTTNIYSEYRGKTLPKNPYFILENDPNYWTLLPPEQSERAAILTFSTLKFISIVKKGQLKPDVTPKHGNALTMKSVNYLFASTRVPSAHGHGINIKHFDKSNHVVILCEGKFHYLKVLNDENQIIIDQGNLQKIFDKIIKDAKLAGKRSNACLSSITTQSREEWALARKHLGSCQVNKDSLHIIDSALLVINLDINKFIVNDADCNYLNICHGTSNIDEITGIQMGSCNSRWYDKLQLIVSGDSLSAILWEPTSNDATVVLRYVSDIYTDSILRLARSINNTSLFSLFSGISINNQYDFKGSELQGMFYELPWDLHDAKLLHRLHLAETRLGDLLCQFDSYTKALDYGQVFADKIGVNADSLVQLAIQLAHYALYGAMVSSCEAVSTRRFENSRSELCFIESESILRICQAFISNTVHETRWELIKQGVMEINDRKNQCRMGYGFEKHIKALRLALIQKDYINKIKSSANAPLDIPELEDLNETEIPSFLSNEDTSTFYKVLLDPEILAINCGNPSLKAFGITPYKPGGFGIGYVIKEDCTVYTISSNHRQNKRFLQTLCWVYFEIEALYMKEAGRKKSNGDATDNGKAPCDVNEMLRTVSISLSKSIDENKVVEHSNSEAAKTESKDSFSNHILGGYGYFDVGELEFRLQSESLQLSRVQSINNLLTINK